MTDAEDTWKKTSWKETYCSTNDPVEGKITLSDDIYAIMEMLDLIRRRL